MAGHSLGELAALVAAGALSERDGLELVALRGQLMQEAGERAGDGGMLALLATGAAEHAAELADAHGLAVANDNSPAAGRALGRARRRSRPPRPRPRSSACARWSCP